MRAVIFTERDSQKGIVIGKGGRMLKASGRRLDWILRTCWGWIFTWIYGLRFVKIGVIKKTS